FTYQERYYFGCEKWLFSWCYQRFERVIYDRSFIHTWTSIKYNLTKKEYRWLKAEIDNFVK
ncbi:MAG: hypothetical protein AAFR83_25930, partial [Cyanobacteria bacterium J06629_18]